MDTTAERWAMLEPHTQHVGPDDDRARPAVLLFHGCGGLRAHLPLYAEAAKAAGIRAFIIDSFGARGWSRAFALATVCTGVRLRGWARAGDVMAAIQGLSQRPDVDGSRLGLGGLEPRGLGHHGGLERAAGDGRRDAAARSGGGRPVWGEGGVSGLSLCGGGGDGAVPALAPLSENPGRHRRARSPDHGAQRRASAGRGLRPCGDRTLDRGRHPRLRRTHRRRPHAPRPSPDRRGAETGLRGFWGRRWAPRFEVHGPQIVIPGLVPGIHTHLAFRARPDPSEGMDRRDKPGDDEWMGWAGVRPAFTT